MTEVLKFTILDAGLVETAVISRPGIEACGLVPYFNKLVHDTLPVLYVVPDEKGSGGVKAVKKGDTLIDVRLIHLDDFQRRIGGGVPDELEHDAEMIKRTGSLVGRASFMRRDENHAGDTGKMIRGLIDSGMLEPEMIGAMIARMLKDSCAERRPERHGHDHYYRGFGR